MKTAQDLNQPYVVTSHTNPATRNFYFTVQEERPVLTEHQLHDKRLLKECFGDLPITRITLKHDLALHGTRVLVGLLGGTEITFTLSLLAYYSNRETNGDIKIPLRYLVERVIEEYHAHFPKPVMRELKSSPLPSAEDLSLDP